MKTITTFAEEGTLFSVSRNLESILLRSNIIVKGEVKIPLSQREEFYNLARLINKLEDIATSSIDSEILLLHEIFETYIRANPQNAVLAYRLSNQLLVLFKDLQLNEKEVIGLSSDLNHVINSFN